MKRYFMLSMGFFFFYSTPIPGQDWTKINTLDAIVDVHVSEKSLISVSGMATLHFSEQGQEALGSSGGVKVMGNHRICEEGKLEIFQNDAWEEPFSDMVAINFLDDWAVMDVNGDIHDLVTQEYVTTIPEDGLTFSIGGTLYCFPLMGGSPGFWIHDGGSWEFFEYVHSWNSHSLSSVHKLGNKILLVGIFSQGGTGLLVSSDGSSESLCFFTGSKVNFGTGDGKIFFHSNLGTLTFGEETMDVVNDLIVFDLSGYHESIAKVYGEVNWLGEIEGEPLIAGSGHIYENGSLDYFNIAWMGSPWGEATTSVIQKPMEDIRIVNNSSLFVTNDKGGDILFSVFSIEGRHIASGIIEEGNTEDLTPKGHPSGIYILRLWDSSTPESGMVVRHVHRG